MRMASTSVDWRGAGHCNKASACCGGRVLLAARARSARLTGAWARSVAFARVRHRRRHEPGCAPGLSFLGAGFGNFAYMGRYMARRKDNGVSGS